MCNFAMQKNAGDSLAQQVEHHTFNVGVLGSSPRRVTKTSLDLLLLQLKACLHICCLNKN